MGPGDWMLGLALWPDQVCCSYCHVLGWQGLIDGVVYFDWLKLKVLHFSMNDWPVFKVLHLLHFSSITNW